MDPTPRAARRDDLPAIYDLLETAFPEAPRELFVNQTGADSTFRLRHARVAIDDGRVVAYVRIFAREMRKVEATFRSGITRSSGSSEKCRQL